ncbi:MAG TPA: fibrobacter succinogenes major paralogous domain-containing protein [Tenuifilaceae bacterium]|nr:fibrobacter succinogenes major paralogous domain-containing protein [Tenuifilaceae bacterium]HOM86126.1 fibrobacter succinogenes major paralogous domain-containing protein [Tenuifilaceae bacterium]HOQ35822.1 fibrobacter succinogenes major paralogous domain-containing protein [Tenuifilaceae bacterium]HPK78186.1 fibrobacter succinogenes major paralogous domain-containing protein [Tenuifilaceae bacterium]HQC67099.1 fibrobacter succinogenes major paralogous domain-containing protein [Tenuifilace
MKKVLLLLIIFGVNFLQVAGQNPSGFNYQAVFRNSAGEIIQNQSVGIRISILKGSSTGDAVYIETFSTTTNSFGLVNLVVGSGSPKEGALSDVEWSSDSYFIKVEVDFQGGSNYAEMGTTQLLSVPYAMHAKSASQFKGEPNGDPDAPLFEVKNSKGAVVFAVYENEVKIFIDEEDDGKTVGGFAVSGRTTTKEVQDLLTVAPGETRVYVDESSGKTVGGFAVSGRTTTKEVEDILYITTDNTQIYVGEGNGKTVGGFAVSGRTTTKEVEDILHITPENTQIYVGEGNGKTVGGFAVSGRTTTKEVEDILHITPENTQIYVGEGNGKTVGGFAVSGRTTTKEVEDILQITPENTQIYVGEGNGKTVGGFAVSGRTTTKGVEDILQITPDNTRIYVSESDGKTVGGFAVSGRTTTKEEGFYDVLKVVPERTDVFIKPPDNKLFPDGFTVSVYNQEMEPTELFNVSEEGIFMNNEVILVPNVITLDATNITQTSAIVGGEVLEYSGPSLEYRGITYSINPNPIADINADVTAESGTILDNTGTGSGEFTMEISDLTPGTKYYYKAFAINEEGTVGYGQQKVFTTVEEGLIFGYFTDVRDNNTYGMINIGSQVWMAENLKYLPAVVGPATGSETEPYYYVYGYDGTDVAEAKATDNYQTYGVLYNWTAAMAGAGSTNNNPSGVQGVCPTGWHLPSYAEWQQLASFLGGGSVAGGKLKEEGFAHWLEPNTGATNETGFTALPGGFREKNDNTFKEIQQYGIWWSTYYFSGVTLIYHTSLKYNIGTLTLMWSDRDNGESVRCVRND